METACMEVNHRDEGLPDYLNFFTALSGPSNLLSENSPFKIELPVILLNSLTREGEKLPVDTDTQIATIGEIDHSLVKAGKAVSIFPVVDWRDLIEAVDEDGTVVSRLPLTEEAPKPQVTVTQGEEALTAG